MKKIERLTQRADKIKSLEKLWPELLELREKLAKSRLKGVIIMYDLALQAFVLEAERLGVQQKSVRGNVAKKAVSRRQ